VHLSFFCCTITLAVAQVYDKGGVAVISLKGIRGEYAVWQNVLIDHLPISPIAFLSGRTCNLLKSNNRHRFLAVLLLFSLGRFQSLN
jgi:hypothetical protein